MPNRKSHYEILGVEPSASQDEIRLAYRELAEEYHPDRNPLDPSARERFEALQRAFEVLGDPERRAVYDRSDGGGWAVRAAPDLQAQHAVRRDVGSDDDSRGHGDEPAPTARPVPGYVPFARPIAPPPFTGIPAHTAEFLLLSSSRARAWADVAVLIACLVLLELLGAAFLNLALDVPIGPQNGATDSAEWEFTRVMLAPTLSIRAVGSILIIAAILVCRGQSIRSVGLRSTALLPNIALGVAAMIVAYALIALTIPVLSLIWPSTRDQMVENAERILKMVPRLDLLGFGGLAIAIGVYEEIVFRGFFMTRLRRATGNWIFAVLLSTAVFTSLHALDQTATALVAVTILSLVFSGVTIWRRSIVPAIVGHALFDWSQFFFLWYQAGDSWA